MALGRRITLAAVALLAPLAAAGCGNILQDQPIASNSVESLVALPHTPIYWLGLTFRGLAITNVVPDPGGAYTLQYGDCAIGGQSICVPPLELVTSPDNSFLPGGHQRGRRVRIRGVRGVAFDQGRTIVLSTGAVVIDIYALNAPVAWAAAQTMVPVNRLGIPGARLPAPLPDSGFASEPLRSQQAPVVHVFAPTRRPTTGHAPRGRPR
ncbi:MAG: hypothetical protein FWD42_07895 [Solirubrobacterales bacterium]|nr:hypothetical protein [Solirubrobacterales bacterium]